MKITLHGEVPFSNGTLIGGIKRSFTCFCCLLIVVCSPIQALSQVGMVEVKEDAVISVQQVFNLIEEQTDYNFIYRSDLLKDLSALSLPKGKIGINTLLDKFLGPNNFTHTFNEKNNTIIVKQITSAAGRTSVEILGKVTDESGEVLIGCTVMEKGTSNGTTTDYYGNFNIQVSGPEAVLAISYTGYKPQEITVGNRSQIDVRLEVGLAQLDEVVVVGYGTAKKGDITGAITSVSGKDINVTKESNALSALAGKAAGVDIRFTTNAPGTSPSILIRGRSSLNFSNEPLIVVDGIPVSSGLADFNPNDIASVQVLKDASAAAIYGARGANGVILITTKRGRLGKAQISYDSYYGVATPFERVPMMNAQQWADLRLEALRTDAERRGVTAPTLEEGLTSQEFEALNAGVDTDWQDLLFQNGRQQNHQLGVSGGTERARYNISINYFEQEGIIKDSRFERLTLRTNLDFDITDKFKVGLSQQVAFSDRENRRHGGLINTSFQSLPISRPYEEDGTTPTTDPLGDGNYWNPLNDLVPGNYIDNDRFFNYFANIFATYQLTDELQFKVNIGPELRFQRSNDFRGTQSTTGRGGQNRASKFNQARTSYTIENLLYYNKTFGGAHKVGGTLLFSVQEIQNEENNISVRDIPSETQTFNNLGVAAPENRNVSSKLDKEKWVSSMLRFNYAFKEKYSIELIGRYDGSSKLAAGNKWGFFPSGSVGWRLSKENFLANSKIVNNLKLNLGYGTVGRNPIDPFTTQGSLFRTEGSFGDRPAFGFRPGTIANPDLKWEITTTTNVGLDFSLFNYKLNGSISYYVGQTSNLLLSRRLPITSGFGNITQNVGQTENEGVELELNAVIVSTKDFSWSASVNFSRNRSRIVQLLDRENDDIGNRWFIGEQLAVHYDRVFDGIWQSDEIEEAKSFGREVGQVKIVDLNGDGRINDDDRQIVGFIDPQWTGGLSSTINFKGFDFTLTALTRQGHTIRQRALFANNSLVGRNNNVVVDYWTPENPSNSFPRPDANRQGPRDEGVINYFDGSYIRIRNISLGYDFSGQVLNAIKLQNLRLYITAQNPFLFRQDDRLIDGVDPDVAGNNNEWLPSPRTILFGLNATF